MPAETVTGAEAGDLFVHRNIANQFFDDDPCVASVVEYAVNQLKVKAIIICGHTGCGGVAAAKSGANLNGALQTWLEPLRNLCHKNGAFDDKVTIDDVVKLNITACVKRLKESNIVQKAWENGQELRIVGWLYNTFSGVLEPVEDDNRKNIR